MQIMQSAKRIQVLSKHTANQIAAGEVVERPASIVKELVENSIDAGSTAITIEINGGGIDYIKITDNGSGILAEDVPTAFLRHATSKISSADDLGHISTLGFRGEALASIAAVSQLTMRTRTKGSECGTEIHIEGGDIKECIECGCAEGTAIEVRNVFYNVPARLKFLKSQRAEGAAISDYAARAIMGNPGVSIKLLNNGKVIYHSPGDGQLRSAIFCIYGGEVLPHIKEVDYDDGRFRITGYVGTESISRPNRQQQSLYINSRYIRSQQISYGVQRAFDTRIMVGKFPFYVLDIGVNYEDVDVNVHPNKMEVRFKDEQGAVRAATIATRMALGDPVAPTIRREDIMANKTAFGSINALNAAVRQEIVQPTDSERSDKQLSYSELFKPADKSPLKLKEPGAAQAASIRSGMGFKYDSASAMEPLRQRYGESVVGPKNARAETKPEVRPVSAAEDIAKKERTLPETAQPDVPVPSAEPETPLKEKPRQAEFGQSHYDIIGQLFSCYWIVQQGESVFFIDQHAAHERRLYERIMNKPLEPDSQMLLMPVIEKLMPEEYQTLMDNLPLFEELGFEIEEFGALTVSVRAVPAILNAPETASFLHEAIGRLEAKNRLSTKDLKRSALIQYSCKHAIKAGALLSKEEIEALLKEFEGNGVPMTCPHGRPIMVRMTKAEFEKLFKRVQ